LCSRTAIVARKQHERCSVLRFSPLLGRLSEWETGGWQTIPSDSADFRYVRKWDSLSFNSSKAHFVLLSHSSAFNSDQEWCRPPCHRFRGIMLLCRLRNITMFIWYHIIVAHYSISTKRRVHRNTTILHLPRWLCKRVSPRHHNSSTHSSSTTIFPLSTRPHSTRCSLPASLLFLHSSEQKHAHRHPSHGTAPLGL